MCNSCTNPVIHLTATAVHDTRTLVITISIYDSENLILIADNVYTRTTHSSAGESADHPELCLIQQGTTGSPLFFVHPIGGTVNVYYPLAQRLKDRTVYGIQARTLHTSEAPIDDAVTMAATYIKCLRSVQARGPYYIGGSSFGGMIAFEMAQQLQQQGESVALLAMIDTPNMQTVYTMRFDDPLHSILGTEFEFPDALQSADFLSKAEYLQQTGKIPLSMKLALQPFAPLWAAHSRAFQHYSPQYYQGNIVFYKATIKTDIYPWDETVAWKHLADNVAVVEVPGNHVSVLSAPNVDTLASHLVSLLK